MIKKQYGTRSHHDRFQINTYRYTLTEPIGKNFDSSFTPDLTPKEMLRLGVFGGAYFDGVDGLIPSDLPKSWFRGVALSPDGKKHARFNYFKVQASQSLQVWQKNGWIHPSDPHGWFQWYCRYYLGRRMPVEDKRQIRRWRAIRRHITQLQKHCRRGDATCRPVQRQALLHWAYDSRIL